MTQKTTRRRFRVMCRAIYRNSLPLRQTWQQTPWIRVAQESGLISRSDWDSVQFTLQPIALILGLGFLLAWGAWATGKRQEASDTRPNGIVFLCDDMGFSDLGCYGGEIDTPRLDRWRAAGFVYLISTTTPNAITRRYASADIRRLRPRQIMVGQR